MVAPLTPLPAGPLSADGDLRGNTHRRRERVARNGEEPFFAGDLSSHKLPA